MYERVSIIERVIHTSALQTLTHLARHVWQVSCQDMEQGERVLQVQRRVLSLSVGLPSCV